MLNAKTSEVKYGYRRNLHSWMNPKLMLGRSGISGFGVFCNTSLRKGEVLSVWGGKVYTRSEVEVMPKNSLVRSIVNQLSNDFFSGPSNETDLDWSDFYNHSCDPNGRVVNSIFLIAVREITRGEEVTFDYAGNNNKELNFKCECGSYACRGFIRDVDMEELKSTRPAIVSDWPTYILDGF